MPATVLERFEALLAQGKDSPLLRFGLGSEHLKLGNAKAAAEHFAAAVALDPQYSAAWKLLGKAQLDSGAPDAARESWQRGVAVAEGRGDQQAAREMRVYLRRLG
jgi:Tfp pilus assembly protein PilF